MFRLGLAQCCHPADGDVLSMADSWASRAEAASVDLLVFPESLMIPFDAAPEEMACQAEPLDGPFCQAMNALAAKHGLWIVYTAIERNELGAAPAARDGATQATAADAAQADAPASMPAAVAETRFPPYNTAVVVGPDGEMRASYRKVHLFDTDFIRESDKVSAGGELLAPVEAPFGRIGIGICYDLRFPELARAAALAGADIMLYPSAWVDGPRKVDQWRTMLASRAIENEFFVAGLSRCDRAFGASGGHAGTKGPTRDYAGHSCVFGPLGEELASAGADEELVVADIDVGAVSEARASMPVLEHLRPDVY